MERKKDIEEKIINPSSGWLALVLVICGYILSILFLVLTIVSIANNKNEQLEGVGIIWLVGFILLITSSSIATRGFKLIHPNEAVVLTLFGNYYGTINCDGFYYVNPFTSIFTPNNTSFVEGEDPSLNQIKKMFIKKISLKAMTLNNDKQKVNDLEGNPIEIGVVVIWRVKNTAQAVFNVENYFEFVSTQTDASIRNIARLYPYDIGDDESSDLEDKSLRASSGEIANEMKNDLQKRVEFAGIEIMEARISHLAYAPEIAAVMLQRQQAKAIIVARQKIVEGAVGMVEMALNKLSENKVVELDDKQKAQMVSNLLVVLCGNKDASPVVNSGNI